MKFIGQRNIEMLNVCCSSRMVIVWTVIVGLLFGGSFLLAFWGIPQIIKNQIHLQTELSNGTEQWERFVELPFPLNFSVRFFQVTNPQDVIKGHAPKLNETEPYVYSMNLSKRDIRFDDPDEDSVTYRRVLTFKFDNSGNTRDTDNITIINPLLMAALQLINPLERIAAAGCLHRILGPFGMDEIFITRTVKQILFDGIPFAFANDSDLGVACGIIRKRLKTIVANIRVIEPVGEGSTEYFRFSILNFKTENYVNPNPDGIYTINRGRTDMTALGRIMRWNGSNKTTTYGTKDSYNLEACQTVRGTDSTIFRPGVEDGQNLVIFNTDICRMVTLQQVSSSASYKGIKAYKYETSKNLFRPSAINPDKDCYCPKATDNVRGEASCYLDGVFDYRPCLGAPILVSQPHFLYADEKYTDGLTGLSPDVDKHGIYLLLEPDTGTPLVGMKRMQMNSILKQEAFIKCLTPKTMYEGVIPFLWVEEGFKLPDKYVDKLKDSYFSKLKIATAVKYSLIGVFSSLFAVSVFVTGRKHCFGSRVK